MMTILCTKKERGEI